MLCAKEGERGLKVEGLYKKLYKLELWKQAYANIGSNTGAMTEGVTEETVRRYVNRENARYHRTAKV